jgi:hypothetical protein
MELIRWFDAATERLPKEPFELESGRLIVKPDIWYGYVRLDIAAGPGAMRDEVLRRDLGLLKAIVEGT